MYAVEVKNPCRCFLRSGYSEKQTFATKDEAKEEAEAMLEMMQKNFCKKHEFVLSQSGLNYIITIRPRG